MPFNGSGTFIRAYNWVTDKINGVNITASRVDTEDDGFAAGLSNCVTRDGQGKMTAAFNPSADASYDLGAPSAQWRNQYLSGTQTAKDYIQSSGRILKKTTQSVTNQQAPAVADNQLFFIPVSSGSYLLEACLFFSCNTAALAGGIDVGFYATFLNFDSSAVTAVGNINGQFAKVGSFSTSITASTSFQFTSAASGFAANWIQLKGTIDIVNATGSPVIGVNWTQQSATPGGTLTAESPSYMSVTRVS